MKKHLLLLLCITAIGLSSCKKEVILPITNRTIKVDLFAANWKTVNGGLTYFQDITVPENNSSFNQSGGIIVAMSFENLNIYETLPQVFDKLSYRFTTDPGFVTIIISDPYGAVIAKPNFDATAKITLIDAQLIP